MKRCQKGTRRNKKTGNCEEKVNSTQKRHTPIKHKMSSTKVKVYVPIIQQFGRDFGKVIVCGCFTDKHVAIDNLIEKMIKSDIISPSDDDDDEDYNMSTSDFIAYIKQKTGNIKQLISMCKNYDTQYGITWSIQVDEHVLN